MQSASNSRHQSRPQEAFQISSRATNDAPQRRVDHHGGQVYHETETIFRSKNATGWIRDFRTPAILKKAALPTKGPRSLFDMAKSQCANELRDLVPEHFEAVPWAITEELWREVVSRHMESFHAWKTLASIYNGVGEFGRAELRYFLSLRQTPLPLRDYYDGLTSSSSRWHVAIRISPKQQLPSDLVQLASITNLAALDLSDGQLLLDTRPSIFDHRIMRSWAELAQARKSFQKLRILMFGWQDNLSEWIFQYLDDFPSLSYLIVTDCKDLHQKNRSTWENLASQKGWTALHAKRSAKTLRTFLEDREFQLGNISNLYFKDQPIDLASNAALEASTKRVRPVIECWIGTPRPWTHIIDEFPGTRTIWFEKASRVQRSASSVPKRPREQTNPVEARPPSPPKRNQRRMKEKAIHGQASDAAALLTELEYVNTNK